MRTIPAPIRLALEEAYSDDPVLVFLTIDHADLDEPIRVVWDVVDYILGGETYQGFPFDIRILNDDAGAPSGRLTIQNIDRRIGAAVKDLSDAPQLTIAIYMASDFDQTVIPRTPIGTPELVYQASNLFLRRITVDATTVTGEIQSWDYLSMPWPSLFANEADFPGLFPR